MHYPATHPKTFLRTRRPSPLNETPNSKHARSTQKRDSSILLERVNLFPKLPEGEIKSQKNKGIIASGCPVTTWDSLEPRYIELKDAHKNLFRYLNGPNEPCTIDDLNTPRHTIGHITRENYMFPFFMFEGVRATVSFKVSQRSQETDHTTHEASMTLGKNGIRFGQFEDEGICMSYLYKKACFPNSTGLHDHTTTLSLLFDKGGLGVKKLYLENDHIATTPPIELDIYVPTRKHSADENFNEVSYNLGINQRIESTQFHPGYRDPIHEIVLKQTPDLTIHSGEITSLPLPQLSTIHPANLEIVTPEFCHVDSTQYPHTLNCNPTAGDKARTYDFHVSGLSLENTRYSQLSGHIHIIDTQSENQQTDGPKTPPQRKLLNDLTTPTAFVIESGLAMLALLIVILKCIQGKRTEKN